MKFDTQTILKIVGLVLGVASFGAFWFGAKLFIDTTKNNVGKTNRVPAFVLMIVGVVCEMMCCACTFGIHSTQFAVNKKIGAVLIIVILLSIIVDKVFSPNRMVKVDKEDSKHNS